MSSKSEVSLSALKYLADKHKPLPKQNENIFLTDILRFLQTGKFRVCICSFPLTFDVSDVAPRHAFHSSVVDRYQNHTSIQGLPHAHILLLVRSEDKPRDTDMIDQRICAELPDPGKPEQAELLDIILNSQIHGPCGARNNRCPCMDGNVCTEKYPKEFCEDTVMCQNGYPLYRRRVASPSAAKGDHTVDARDVVPYNPFLSKKYACHLNVEACASIKSVKYLYKYNYKGHDRAALEFKQDEVQQYLDTRYVGAPEACWRLLGFHMHDKSHIVERLAVHLDRKQSVVFIPGFEKEALEKAGRTTLLAWFRLNANSAEWRHLRYAEIPQHCTWHKDKGEWKKRERQAWASRVLGRLHTAQPSEGERFFSYLLLLHVPGAQSFEDLKTVDGALHDSFRQAALAMGLIDSDEEYEHALAEAAFCQSPTRMRKQKRDRET